MTAVSCHDGAFATSTTISVPVTASATPSPVKVLTPEEGDAATTSWPRWRRLFTSFVPMRPVPPMTTIFILLLLCVCSNAFVNQLGKEIAVNKASSPLRVISSSGLCRHYFIKGFAFSFESSNTIVNGRKRIAVFDHFGFAADRAVARNDNCFVGDPRDVCLRGANHSIKASASRIVDEREISVPPRVAGVQNIRFCEIDGNVAVGVSRVVTFERNGGAIPVKRLVGVEHISG